MRKLMRSVARSWAADHGQRFVNVGSTWRLAVEAAIKEGRVNRAANKAREARAKQRRALA